MLPLIALLAAAPSIEMLRMPAGETVTTHLDEATIALNGSRMAAATGFLAPAETKGLAEQLQSGYRELAAERGARFPSPVLRDQSATAFDMVVIPPLDGDSGDSAAIFLHGFGGAWTLECWLFARAAKMLTVCPSTTTDGIWTGKGGTPTVKTALDWLEAKGKKRILLAGLSNGGMGASDLARVFEKQLVGAIAISGVGAKGPAKLPMLILSGKNDTMASVANARFFAKGRPERRLEIFDSNHFLLLNRRDEVAARVADWLAALP